MGMGRFYQFLDTVYFRKKVQQWMKTVRLNDTCDKQEIANSIVSFLDIKFGYIYNG